MTNRSAVLHAAHQLTVEDREIPTPGPDEVLVRVAAVGICGSDVHYYEHGRIGSYIVDQPMIIGHEAAGTITDVGTNIDRNRIGQRVALEPGVPCRNCDQCLSGRYNLCPDVQFYATPPVDGAIAEYVTIAASFAHPVPDGLDLEIAAMAEPVSVGIWACRRANVTVGDRVLVTGAGPIGLLTAQVASNFGASTVTITDMNPFRLDVAADLGLNAQPANAPLTEEYDVVLECSGAPAAFRSALNATARTGRIVLIGMGADQMSFDVPLIQGREITLTGTFRYANTYPQAINLLASGAVDLTTITTHRFTIDQTELALTLAQRDPNSLKALVVL